MGGTFEGKMNQSITETREVNLWGSYLISYNANLNRQLDTVTSVNYITDNYQIVGCITNHYQEKTTNNNLGQIKMKQSKDGSSE